MNQGNKATYGTKKIIVQGLYKIFSEVDSDVITVSYTHLTLPTILLV